MKRKLLKNLLCFTICSSVFAGLFSVPALEVFAVKEETQNAIDKTEDEKEKLEEELQQQEQEKASLENQVEIEKQHIHSLRQQYQAMSNNLEVIEAEIAAKKVALEDKKKELDVELSLQKEQYEAMKKRIQYSYETPKESFLFLFFRNFSMAEMLNHIDHTLRIQEYDREQMQKYARTTEEISRQKQSLETEMAQLEELQIQAGEIQLQLLQLQRETRNSVGRALSAVDDVEQEIGDTRSALAEKSELLQSLYAKAQEEEEDERRKHAQKDADSLQNAIAGGNIKQEDSGITYGQLNLTQDEMEMLTAMIYCEARGESYEGQLAVGYVILNRIRSSKFPNDLESVLRQNKQFEPAGSGRFDIVLTAYLEGIPGVISSSAWESCKKAAYECINGTSNVGECLYFRTHAPVPQLAINLEAAGMPYWIIGNHIFYYSWIKY